MTPTLSQVKNWDIKHLTDAANYWTERATVWEDCFTQYADRVNNPGGVPWEGKAAEAAQQRAHSDRLTVCALADKLHDASKIARTGVWQLAEAQRLVLRSVDAAQEAGFTVGEDFSVTDHHVYNMRAAAGRQAQAQGFTADLRAHVGNLVATDQRIASEITTAAAGLGVDPFTESGGASAPHGADDQKAVTDKLLGNAADGAKPNESNADDPQSPLDALRRDMLRAQEEATTVREVGPEITDKVTGDKTKTITMLDGSKHEIRSWPNSATGESNVQEMYYGKNGDVVGWVHTVDSPDGSRVTRAQWGDGTILTATRAANGKVSGTVDTADGRHGVLPDEFFADPVSTTASGAMKGLETAIDKQGEKGIPIFGRSLEQIKPGLKYAGPLVGIAQTAYAATTAANFHDACLATYQGSFSVAGAEAVGGGLAIAAIETGPFDPLIAMGGDMLGAWTFGYVGKTVGNVVCPVGP